MIYGLINSFKILPIGGVIAVVTFNSIEDKIVKFFFRNYSEKSNSSRYLPNSQKEHQLFKLFNKKPILPSGLEVKTNLRSRSAKLRYAIKISDKNDFSELIRKFNKYISVEELFKKL